jgi:hypothetical protein
VGRRKWKIENGTFNVLKNKGYNLEHSFGHGKQNLAAILVSLNPSGFRHAHHLRHWRRALAQRRTKLGPQYNFFSMLTAIATCLILPSWDGLLLTLAFAKPPPNPPSRTIADQTNVTHGESKRELLFPILQDGISEHVMITDHRKIPLIGSTTRA